MHSLKEAVPDPKQDPWPHSYITQFQFFRALITIWKYPVYLLAYLLSVSLICPPHLIYIIHCLEVKSSGIRDRCLSLNISSGPHYSCDYGQFYLPHFLIKSPVSKDSVKLK